MQRLPWAQVAQQLHLLRHCCHNLPDPMRSSLDNLRLLDVVELESDVEEQTRKVTLRHCGDTLRQDAYPKLPIPIALHVPACLVTHYSYYLSAQVIWKNDLYKRIYQTSYIPLETAKIIRQALTTKQSWTLRLPRPRHHLLHHRT